MTIEPKSKQPPGLPASPPLLPLVLLLFVGSGCAALVYEIVWFQLLQLVIGSSAVSLAVLLGTFMGGMCVGSLVLPRLISPRWHPLRVYAWLELSIGIIGIAVLFGMPWIGKIYSEMAGEHASIWLRALVCVICLLPPTILMGATLPAIARWVQSTPQGIAWLGFFYGGNIAGAVIGCLLAGFYLLRLHDLATATYVAAAIDVVVAVGAFALAAIVPYRQLATDAKSQAAIVRNPGWQLTYLVIALSGMTALSAEVVWTRLLSLMLGPTVYTFSIILAVFLIGLGVGSSVGSVLTRSRVDPRLSLACCQLLVAGAIAWAAHALANSLPYWPIDATLSKSAWFLFDLDILRCVWAIFPAACFWGASFPLAVAAVAVPGQDTARLVGGIYGANTIGTIFGALGASLLLVSWIGTQHLQQAMIGASLLAALIMLVPWTLQALPTRGLAAAGSIAAFAFLGWLAWQLPPVPWELIAHGRYLPTRDDLTVNSQGRISLRDSQALYVGEGMNASVAVTLLNGVVRNFHVSGKIEASSEPQDMRLQRMLGHIPAVFHPEPKSVLIVGCGAGVTAGSFVVYPSIEKIVICEIEPLIPQEVAKKYFRAENYDVVNDKRVEIVYDDARHYLLRTKQKFDIITSDPIHPWVKGAATLYTQEYFELVKQHLNPGGLVTQWVPLYESTPEVVKSEIATFCQVFPHATLWSNDDFGAGYDTVLLGQAEDEPLRINTDELQQRWGHADYVRVAQSLSDVGFAAPLDLLSTYAGRAGEFDPWLADAQINRDSNLRLQYLAGWGLNAFAGTEILRGILQHIRFPEDLFVCSPEFRAKLEAAIKRN